MAGFLRPVAVLVLGLLAVHWTLAGSPKALQIYLERAESAGIIDKDQSLQLAELASSMGLRFILDTAEQLTPETYNDTGDTSDTTNITASQERASIFMRIYNHLTLLNVLYLSGAVVVMGAYTIFMTLAVERCSHMALAGIMGVQVAGVGWAGVALWYTVQFAYVGGLLCTLSTSMVPFSVYHVQRALKLWPVKDPGNFVGFNQWIRPGWVVMEIATITVGVAYLYAVRFPFLLFPISFCLWYLSMDLAPLWPGFDKLSYSGRDLVRVRVSIAMGVLMMLLGYVSETVSGSDPDLGFWLYFFGLLTFFVAINFDYPESDVYGSLFLLICMSLVLIGSWLNRTTFQVFGTIGVIEYVVAISSLRIKMMSSTGLWLLKGLVAVVLFSQAVRSGGNIEVLGGLVCVFAFNFSFINFVTSGKIYAFILLVTNLGFVGISGAFSRPLDVWLFTLPDIKLIFSVLTSMAVLVYHVPVLVMKKEKFDFSSHAFLFYRLVSSVAVSFAMVFLRQAPFAGVGAMGVLLVAYCYHSYAFRARPHKWFYAVVALTLSLLSVVFSLFLQSNPAYFLSCLLLLFLTLRMLDDLKILGCFCAVLLVLLSVPLNSKFVIVIGALYIILYLSHLAHSTFKNSLLFPLVLIALGLGMIGVAVLYQQYEAVVHEGFYSLIPAPVQSLASSRIQTWWVKGGVSDWSYHLSRSEFTLNSVMSCPYVWVLWPGALTFALVNGPAAYMTYMCAVAVLLLVSMATWMSVRDYMKRPLDMDVKVHELNISLSQDPAHNNHGLVIKIKGTKPLPLAAPPYVALTVADGSYFWTAAGLVYSSFAVSMARTVLLPYKITPHLITLTGFIEGSASFSATILLGTGHKGSQRMKHKTAITALRKLVPRVSELPCVVLYANHWYQPWSTLTLRNIDLSTTLGHLTGKGGKKEESLDEGVKLDEEVVASLDRQEKEGKRKRRKK